MNPKIFIAVGAYAPVEPHVYSNHVMWSALESKKLRDTGIQFGFQCWARTPLITFRNEAAEFAFKGDPEDFTHLMFIDDDLKLELDGPSVIARLLNASRDGVGAAVVHTRAWPYFPMVWREDRMEIDGKMQRLFGPVLSWEKGEELVVDAVSLACAMIRVDLLKKLFETHHAPFWSWYKKSDDIHFGRIARLAGATIRVDTTIQTIHMGRKQEIGRKLFRDTLPEAEADPERVKRTLGCHVLPLEEGQEV